MRWAEQLFGRCFLFFWIQCPDPFFHYLHRLLIHQTRRQLRHLAAAAVGETVEEDGALRVAGGDEFCAGQVKFMVDGSDI